MKKVLNGFLCAMGVVALAFSTAPTALAACGDLSLPTAHPSSWYPQVAQPRLLRAGLNDQDNDEGDGSIVGMWHVKFIAQTMNGAAISDTPIDNALVVWHRDGTEIMNSGRPPQDGDFCMGVWERTGGRSYSLNHFAWAGNQFPNALPPSGVGAPDGPAHIVERVTLDPDGDHYTGRFTLTQYGTSGNVEVSFTGVITATRITLNTTVGDLI